MSSDEMLQVALDYLDQHFYTRYLFPIEAGRKFPPLVRDNLEGNASNDPAQIRRWAKRWPGCNWGLAHRKSKLLVVDVDANKAKGKVGLDTFDALSLAYDFPATERTETPSGGFHLIYEGPHIFALGENFIGRDIDSPNYTLIAGCRFEDGTSYVGNGADAVKCPQWIYDLVSTAKTRSKVIDASEAVVELDKIENIRAAIDFLQNDAEAAIEGQGGDINTLKTAMYLKDLGISPELALDLMDEFYNPRCQPEWQFDDLKQKVANAYNYATLSKVGGKTAEAEFAADPIPDIEPMGDPEVIEAERRQRERARRAETDNPQPDRSLTRQELIKQWVWITGIERFVYRNNTKRVWKRSAFDAHYGYLPQKGEPKSISECLFRVRLGTIQKFTEMVYKPGLPAVVDGAFNAYVPPDIVPVQGDTTWWDEHLEYLFPGDDDRALVLNWLAWVLQNMAKKPKHALLLQGAEQGTGKSFIADMFSRILNRRNVSALNQSNLHGDFNGWAARAKLVLIEELRALDRTEVANKLHPLITQELISINEKNIPQYETENVFALFAMTNHDAAITLDQSDRRYLVINTDVKPREPAYYVQLYGRLSNKQDIAAVAWALMNRDVGEYNGSAAAPITSAKADMIDAGASDLEHFLMDKAAEFPLNGRVISVQDVIEMLPKRLESRSPRLYATIRGILLRRFKAIDLGPIRTPDGKRPRLLAIRGNGAILQGMAGSAVGAIYTQDKIKAGKGETIDPNEASSDFDEV